MLPKRAGIDLYSGSGVRASQSLRTPRPCSSAPAVPGPSSTSWTVAHDTAPRPAGQARPGPERLTRRAVLHVHQCPALPACLPACKSSWQATHRSPAEILSVRGEETRRPWQTIRDDTPSPVVLAWRPTRLRLLTGLGRRKWQSASRMPAAAASPLEAIRSLKKGPSRVWKPVQRGSSRNGIVGRGGSGQDRNGDSIVPEVTTGWCAWDQQGGTATTRRHNGGGASHERPHRWLRQPEGWPR